MAVESLLQSLDNPPSTKSDSTGQFEISGLPLRDHHVYASKPQDGYPNADPAYDEENQAAIALSSDRPSPVCSLSGCDFRSNHYAAAPVTHNQTRWRVRRRIGVNAIPVRLDRSQSFFDPRSKWTVGHLADSGIRRLAKWILDSDLGLRGHERVNESGRAS
jgi:hypothetical protein